MPRKGENIYKRKDGRWKGRYIKSKSHTGTTLYGYCYGKSYKEVKELLALKKGHCTVETHKSAEMFTFSKYCNEWLYLRRNKVEESTYVKYISMMEKHIIPGLGDRIITELTSVVIEDFSQSLLLEKELSPKTVKRCTCSAALRYCLYRENHKGWFEKYRDYLSQRKQKENACSVI